MKKDNDNNLNTEIKNPKKPNTKIKVSKEDSLISNEQIKTRISKKKLEQINNEENQSIQLNQNEFTSTDLNPKESIIDDLDKNDTLILDFYKSTQKISKRIIILTILFFLVIPIIISIITQFIWAINCVTFSSFLHDKKLKKSVRSWGILGILFFPLLPIFIVKSKLQSHIMKLDPENIVTYLDNDELIEETNLDQEYVSNDLNVDDEKDLENTSYIEKKIIPHLTEEEANSHYIICEKIDKSIKSLAFSSDILHSIDLFIDKGDIVVILGPSGSGKTTLLNIMAGVDKPTNGHVYIDGKCITDMNDKNITLFRKEEISYIYQRYGLIPILSVFDNIRIGQELVKKDKRNVDLNDLISTMGLSDLLEKFPHELSGGQKQRVSIARAIAKQPNVMFCDEPTGALDKENAEMIIDLFLKLNLRFKTTIIIVTHDNNLVKNANKIIHLRDGNIWKTEIVKKKKVDITSNKISSNDKL